MSLRARLLAVLLALSALGLIALAAITYAEQRNFLVDRVDDQARAAMPAMEHRLDEGDIEAGRGSAPPPGEGRGPGEGRPPGGGKGGPAPVNLPPGTYGEHRDASGKVTDTAVITYGQDAPAEPDLPKDVPYDQPITVNSVDGSELRYRALAQPARAASGTTVVAVPLSEADDTLEQLLLVEALVIGGVLIALAALAWWLVRVGMRPLDRMGETAGAIAAGDLSRRVSPATERTEVGRLGVALNSMLSQIEKAFAEREASENRLRRFIADASHELRTPLASIRGYAEVFRMGAKDKPAEAEKAMRRIEDESARMGVLVEDLLALARLDQLPETSHRPVDLVHLARDAVDDARAAAPDRHIDLEAEGEVTVLGDSSQLRQVVGNLMRNALVHTPPGTAIELQVRADGPDATLAVRDHGPGLPTEDTDALFERFWRADPGRERGAAGAGLGLSIVAAIVAAHGGAVSATNAPGGGAAFTVRLPTS